MQDETAASTTSGYPMLVVLPVTVLTGVAGAALLSGVAIKILSLVVAVLALICLAGFYMVAPNEGRVLQLFGQYVGTDRALGAALGQSVLLQTARIAAYPQLREWATQSQRLIRQPHRDCRRCRVAGRRYRRGGVRGG